MNNLIDSDDLEEISVHSADLDVVDELFRDSDSVFVMRKSLLTKLGR